jgi:uncharacterized protein
MELYQLKVAMTGAGGFIGSALKEFLGKRKCTVIPLTRSDLAMPLPQLSQKLEGVHVIVNLAGEPIIGRWTKRNMKAIYDSRILTTRKIVNVLQAMSKAPEVFISGSAVGIYDSKGIHSESSVDLAGDFLGKLCQDWEAEVLSIHAKTRVIILRTGVVLGKDGGALSRMLPLFKTGIGGVIASGKQGFSWIHLNDLLNAIDFLVANPHLSGVFNLTAPQLVDNRIFTKTLARILGKREFLPVPALLLKILYGKGAKTLIEGQKAYPQRLLDSGFRFEFLDLEIALKEIVVKDQVDSI